MGDGDKGAVRAGHLGIDLADDVGGEVLQGGFEVLDADVDCAFTEFTHCFELRRLGINGVLDCIFAEAAEMGCGGSGFGVILGWLHWREGLLVECVRHVDYWLERAPSGSDNCGWGCWRYSFGE